MLESKNNDVPTKTLRELRESLGYSQENLAAKLGLTRNAYARYELRQSEPKVSNFITMARELRVSLKTLADAMGFDITGIPDDTPN